MTLTRWRRYHNKPPEMASAYYPGHSACHSFIGGMKDELERDRFSNHLDIVALLNIGDLAEPYEDTG